MSIKVLIADDHKIVRQGLVKLLQTQDGLEIIGECDNGRDTISVAAELRPDVVIMDIGMPDLNGIDATKLLVAELPETHVIALSMHSERKLVAGMLDAGASGYLLKDCPIEELVEAIKAVANDRTYLSPAIAGVVIDDYVRHLSGEEVPSDSPLSPRERQVLQLLAEGSSTKEIAAGLHVSSKTIESHRRNIMEKLKIDSVAGLTKYAVREGLTGLD